MEVHGGAVPLERRLVRSTPARLTRRSTLPDDPHLTLTLTLANDPNCDPGPHAALADDTHPDPGE